jgi:phosphoribosylformylglycinamidine synthase
MAIAEVCRNLVCAGAEPIGITDCLNFASPEDPATMDVFARAIDGLAEACRTLDVPIVSGNVSLYNETSDASGRHPILPTPGVAAVGLVADEKDILTQAFKAEGDVILLLGDAGSADARGGGLGGSEYQAAKAGRLGGPAPGIDLEAEKKLQRLVLDLARAHVLSSAHDVSDGGIAVALAECCTTSRDGALIGAHVTLPSSNGGASPVAATLFGEAPSRVIVSLPKAHAAEVETRARDAGVPLRQLGHTNGEGAGATLRIAIVSGPRIEVPAADLRNARESCLDGIVGA